MAIAAAATMGCFYIESPAMRLLEKKAGSGDFEQLVIQSSIIRPAANEFVREYVRRLHGGGLAAACIRTVGDVLDETFGLMVYQEDVVARWRWPWPVSAMPRPTACARSWRRKTRRCKLRDYQQQFFAGCRAPRGRRRGRIDRDLADDAEF